MIEALAGTLVQAVGCLGLGLALLRLPFLRPRIAGFELAATAMILGIGGLGWLVFLLGQAALLRPAILWILLAACCVPAILLRPACNEAPARRLTPIEWPLMLVLAGIVLGNLAEAVSPPTDADSLAYHYAIPKLFLADGRITFIPRAVDGAVPLLLQMTSVSARALGGELGMTLWAAVTFWSVAALFFAICRPLLTRPVAIAATAVLMTVPAVVHGAITGQTEIRMAGFVLLAAAAAARFRTDGRLADAALTGLAAGLLAASKYTGLLLAPACLVPILLAPARIRGALVFGVAAALAAFQWYLWNFVNTGDPVFPMLQAIFPAPPHIWSADQRAYFEATWNGNELGVPQTLPWFLAYPFLALLAPPLPFEATRNGLGPFLWLALPFGLFLLWRGRSRIAAHPLASHALVALSFAILWFFLGASQRVRFFVPILPAAVLIAGVALDRFRAACGRGLPVAALFAITLALHGAAFALYHKRYVTYLAGPESRSDFLRRNVAAYDAVLWLNRNVRDGAVLTATRQINYYLDVPYFYGHPLLQSQIILRPEIKDVLKFHRQARAHDVRYVLSVGEPNLSQAGDALVALGCAETVLNTPVQALTSRTFGWTDTPGLTALAYRLSDGEKCRP